MLQIMYAAQLAQIIALS